MVSLDRIVGAWPSGGDSADLLSVAYRAGYHVAAFSDDGPKQTLMVLVTAGVLFGFYGAAGLLEGGPISHQISRVSVYFILPLFAATSWFLVRRRSAI